MTDLQRAFDVFARLDEQFSSRGYGSGIRFGETKYGHDGYDYATEGGGRDELNVAQLAQHLDLSVAAAGALIQSLSQWGCIEIASTSVTETRWRLVAGAASPS